ncbi:hypothetical protein Tco_0376523, partial [Tanacetum coccineum]
SECYSKSDHSKFDHSKKSKEERKKAGSKQEARITARRTRKQARNHSKWHE